MVVCKQIFACDEMGLFWKNFIVIIANQAPQDLSLGRIILLILVLFGKIVSPMIKLSLIFKTNKSCALEDNSKKVCCSYSGNTITRLGLWSFCSLIGSTTTLYHVKKYSKMELSLKFLIVSDSDSDPSSPKS